MGDGNLGLTARLAAFLAVTDAKKIPDEAFEHAKVAFLDWVAVTVAGKDDPLVRKLIDYANTMGGNEQATIVGHGVKKSISQAALINGSASHALDYDDTLASFLGHPSVTLFPSLLALAEWQEKSGEDFLAAYLIGLQVGITIAQCAGMEHYMAGWHGTSTIGHLASAAGCAWLLGLDAKHSAYALGVADLSQKYHASCHATHSPLEATLAIVEKEQVPLDEIEAIHVQSSQLALDAAGKKEASTGLEGKFCIPYCVANALVTGQTGTQAFTDEKVQNPVVRALMEKITVALDPEMKTLESSVEMKTKGGKVFSVFRDVLKEIPALETKRERVKSKYFDLCGQVIGPEKTAELADRILGLEKLSNVRPFAGSL